MPVLVIQDMYILWRWRLDVLSHLSKRIYDQLLTACPRMTHAPDHLIDPIGACICICGDLSNVSLPWECVIFVVSDEKQQQENIYGAAAASFVLQRSTIAHLQVAFVIIHFNCLVFVQKHFTDTNMRLCSVANESDLLKAIAEHVCK
jgi:hypothetical protein